MAIDTVENSDAWAGAAQDTLRRLSAVTWAGGLLGLLVGGVGGRLAMMVLARLNPDIAGGISDDGFTMGRLTLQTLDLMRTTTLIGVFGGGVYFVLRRLMVGPRWFQILSVSLGPAIVVGSSLVHVDGVDFTLEPVWLAIALFVAIPWAYAALLTIVAERWLRPTGAFMTARLWLALCPLALWAPIAPFLALLLVGLVAVAAARRTQAGELLLAHPMLPWLARAALAALFGVCLVRLLGDTVTLL